MPDKVNPAGHETFFVVIHVAPFSVSLNGANVHSAKDVGGHVFIIFAGVVQVFTSLLHAFPPSVASTPLEHEPLIVKNLCCPGATSPNVVELAAILQVFLPAHAVSTIPGAVEDVKVGEVRPVAKLPPTLVP